MLALTLLAVNVSSPALFFNVLALMPMPYTYVFKRLYLSTCCFLMTLTCSAVSKDSHVGVAYFCNGPHLTYVCTL